MTLNTRLTTYFIVALSLFGVTKAYSQQFFTFDSNSPRGGDVLIGERIHLDSIADLFHSRLTDETGKTTHYDYDGLGRLTEVYMYKDDKKEILNRCSYDFPHE